MSFPWAVDLSIIYQASSSADQCSRFWGRAPVLINYAHDADARENAWWSIQCATGCSRATIAENAKRLKDAA